MARPSPKPCWDLAGTLESENSSIALIRQMVLKNSALPHPRRAHDIEPLAMFHSGIGDGKEGVQAFLEKRPANFTAKASAMPPFFPWD
jgi:hypothetical protein